METYITVELVSFSLWSIVFAARLRRRSLEAIQDLVVLLFSLPAATVMEVRNEYLQAGSGVYYPNSLYFFPGFKFPLAIIFSSSLFAWALLAVSRRIVSTFAGTSRARPAVLWFVFLVLISTNSAFEWLGVALGYWRWHVTPPTTLSVWIAKYLFYFWFSVPPLAVSALLSWQIRRHSRPKTSPG